MTVNIRVAYRVGSKPVSVKQVRKDGTVDKEITLTSRGDEAELIVYDGSDIVVEEKKD